MRNDFYPAGAITNLLDTSLVTANTKNILNGRLQKTAITAPRYFSPEHFEVLKSVCGRIIPQYNRTKKVDLPGLAEDQLASGRGNGWRYASMPEDNRALILGLTGTEESSVAIYGTSFSLLDVLQQDQLLLAIQHGTIEGNTWQFLSSKLFFEELLTRLVEIYYSHPLAKEEIGDVSFADAKGWNRVGLDELEEHEPKAIKSFHNK